MPCCAFAAFFVSQFVVVFAAIKRWILGIDADGGNSSVEWRLGAASTPRAAFAWRGRAMRGLAIAAAVELLLVIGAAYGLAAHLRHGHDHTGHVHSQENQP